MCVDAMQRFKTDEIKQLPIVTVAERLGIEVNRASKARCFIGTHQDEVPSLHFNQDKNYYHCFGCEAHGDVIELVKTVR